MAPGGGGVVEPDLLVLQDCADELAAASVTISDACNRITFTGTAAPVATIANCTAVTDGTEGRQLFIECGADATVFTTTGNINLKADFTCSVDAVLHLMCDGVNWNEVAHGVVGPVSNVNDGSMPSFSGTTGKVLKDATNLWWQGTDFYIFNGSHIARSGSQSTSSSRLTLQHSRAGADPRAGPHTLLLDGDDTGLIQFQGADGTTFINSASITGRVDGVASLGDVPGELLFHTAPLGGALTERMRISAEGVVTVGTLAPDLFRLPVNATPVTVSANTINVDNFSVVTVAQAAATIKTINTCSASETGKPLTVICPPLLTPQIALDETGNITLGDGTTTMNCRPNMDINFFCNGTKWILINYPYTSTATGACKLNVGTWECDGPLAMGFGGHGLTSFAPDTLVTIDGTGNNFVFNSGLLVGNFVTSALTMNDNDGVSFDTNLILGDADETADIQALGNLYNDIASTNFFTMSGAGTDQTVSGISSAGTVTFSSIVLTQSAISDWPLSIGRGGTGLTTFTADRFLTTDGIGLIQTDSGKAIPSGVVVGTTDAQTLTNKKHTGLVSTDGVFDSELATAGTAHVFDATAGGHSGNFFDFQDSGSSLFKLTDEENLYMSDAGFRRGGIYQSGANTVSWPAGGSIQPKNIFLQNYTGALSAAKQYSAFYVEVGVKHNNIVTNSDIFGVNLLIKYLNNNTSRIRTVAGGRFTVQEATWGGGSTIGGMIGGDFITAITQTTAATITENYGGRFQVQLNSGQNKTINTAFPINVKGPNGATAAGTTVVHHGGVYIEDQRNDQVQATNSDAIKINSQTADGAVGTDGNIRMVGGAYNTGHLQLASTHLWTDGTDFFYKLSVPADATDGIALPRAGAAPPATCNAGAIFIDTDETDDTNCTTTNDNSLCLCTAADTWTALENN